jgi:hypothetical protein
MSRTHEWALANEIHGLSYNGQVVITAQHWRRSDGRAAIVTVHNGRIAVRPEYGTDAEAVKAMAEAHAKLAEVQMTTAAAEAKLTALVPGWTRTPCLREECGGKLAIGEYRCADCGRAPGRVAAGLLAAAGRRGAIHLRATASVRGRG